jgi:thiamine-monophosphate kinase
MKRMDDISENVSIDAWARSFSRSPRQANAPHESDAELVELPGAPGSYLAITIDTVAEEIAAGLYRDPFTMGWVTAMATLSDLAAVGAEPLGLVISASTPPGAEPPLVEGVARGIEEACRSLGVFVLGGDSNAAAAISFTACAVGLVPKDAVLTRRGLRPGDSVFLTGRAGAGNALGLVRLAGLPERCFPEERYRPVARLAEGTALRGRAGVCMDTSDGVLSTLDQLMRLNGHGFEVECAWENILDPSVLALCKDGNAPPWMMLAGPHGEFELVFTLSEPDADAIRDWGIPPIRIGTVRESCGITLVLPSGERTDIDMGPIRNLVDRASADPDDYLRELAKIGRSWGLD